MKKSVLPLIFKEPAVIDPPEPICRGKGPYRANVAALILRRVTTGLEILLGERRDLSGSWQWPQGGMDKGETPEETLVREMREEIGVESVEILYRFPFTLRYRLPKRMGRKFYPFVGQEQLYFAVRLPQGETPDLAKASDDEFRELRWFPLEQALQSAAWFKFPVYEAALSHLHEVIESLAL